MKIVKLLTDNGSQFTDRFTSKKREPTGHYAFDVRCAALNIEHRLCPPRHPQTNEMVERFNGRISEVVSQTRFAPAAELETTLERYVKTYQSADSAACAQSSFARSGAEGMVEEKTGIIQETHL